MTTPIPTTTTTTTYAIIICNALENKMLRTKSIYVLI
jgi:hypothetical protein